MTSIVDVCSSRIIFNIWKYSSVVQRLKNGNGLSSKSRNSCWFCFIKKKVNQILYRVTDELWREPVDCCCKIFNIQAMASDEEKQLWYVLKKWRFFFNWIEERKFCTKWFHWRKNNPQLEIDKIRWIQSLIYHSRCSILRSFGFFIHCWTIRHDLQLNWIDLIHPI